MPKVKWTERDKALMQFTSDLLEICYSQDEMTTSDLQGVIQAKVMEIIAWNPMNNLFMKG